MKRCAVAGMLALALSILTALSLAADAWAAERPRPFVIGVLTDGWGPTPGIVGLRDGLLELVCRR